MSNYILNLYLKIRVLKYSFFSNNRNVKGSIIKHQPVVFRGKGAVLIGENVNIGVINSPGFYNSYAYIEARNKNAVIEFGNNIHINNNFSATSEKSIKIEDHVLIGHHCSIIDSSFHHLNKNKRAETDPNPEEIVIKNNVFIGNNVTILKGVTIGENSIVSNGAVITKSFGSNVIIGGVPAKVIKTL